MSGNSEKEPSNRGCRFQSFASFVIFVSSFFLTNLKPRKIKSPNPSRITLFLILILNNFKAREKLARASKKQVIFSMIIAILSLALLIVGLAFVWKYREDIDNIAYYNKHGEWRDTCQKVCAAKLVYPFPPNPSCTRVVGAPSVQLEKSKFTIFLIFGFGG